MYKRINKKWNKDNFSHVCTCTWNITIQKQYTVTVMINFICFVHIIYKRTIWVKQKKTLQQFLSHDLQELHRWKEARMNRTEAVNQVWVYFWHIKEIPGVHLFFLILQIYSIFMSRWLVFLVLPGITRRRFVEDWQGL